MSLWKEREGWLWKKGDSVSQKRLSQGGGNRQGLRSLLFEGLCPSMRLMLLLSPSLKTLECQEADHPRGAPCVEETTAKGQGLAVGTQGVSQQ